jgi:hypothetical protein
VEGIAEESGEDKAFSLRQEVLDWANCIMEQAVEADAIEAHSKKILESGRGKSVSIAQQVMMS